MKSKIFVCLIAFLALILPLNLMAQGYIDVRLWGGSNYLIYSGHTTASVSFDINAGGLDNTKSYKVGYMIDFGQVVLSTVISGVTDCTKSFDVDLGAGSHYITCMLYYSQNLYAPISTVLSTVFCLQQAHITIENSFNAGSIIVNSNTTNSGYSFTTTAGVQISVGAIDQDYNLYHYVWLEEGTNPSRWLRASGGSTEPIIGSTRNYTYTVQSADDGAALIADMRKVCSIGFQNSFGGTNGGDVMVNSTQYNSPTSSFSVTEGNSIQVHAYDHQCYNRVYYAFNRWVDGSQYTISTDADLTISPSTNMSYTAIYLVDRPLPPDNVDVGGGTRFHPHPEITWIQHPSPAVDEYQIWRTITPMGGSEQEAELIATVSSSTTSYTDVDILVTSGHTDLLLKYDVRAHLTTNETYSVPEWHSQFGTIPQQSVKPVIVTESDVSVPTEYKVGSYPNPFNPSTQIRIDLPEASNVSLVVYDMLGKEVASLANGLMAAGVHSFSFNASKLAAGVYLYKIIAAPMSESSRPFVRVNKIILAK